MSTTAALMASNSAMVALSASQNSQRLAEKKARCEVEIESFDPSTATIDQAKSYADCIETLYPSALSSAGVLWIKFFLILMVAGFLYGLIKSIKEGKDIEEGFLFTVLTAIGFPFFGLVVFGFSYGVYFIFAG